MAALASLRRGIFSWPINLASQVVKKLLTERASPARLGWAVALGVLIGCSPFIGFHLMMVLVIATLLGLNRAITYLAANISVPWMQPILLFMSLQLGTFALTGEFLAVEMSSLEGVDPVDFGLTWLLGSFILGVVIGAPAGLITFGAMSAYRARHPLDADPVADAREWVAQRYRVAGRFAHGYVRGKLEQDPVYRQLADRRPLRSPLLDIGCGRGHAILLLQKLQPDLTATGIDWDGAKIEQARAVADEGRATFEVADVAGYQPAAAGTITLIDVLHYHDLQTQDAMLRRAAAAIEPGGRLLIRDVDNGRGFRAFFTRAQERIGQWMRLNRGRALAFRTAESIRDVLHQCGLETEIEPSWGELPFANVLIEARRSG